MEKEISAKQIIDALGGPAKVSREFKITSEAVTQWKRNGIPHGRMMYIKVAYPKLFRKSK